jgi:hypothetical protein
MTLHAPFGSLKSLSQTSANRKPERAKYTFTRPADTTAYAAGDFLYPAVPGAGSQIKAIPFLGAVANAGQETLLLSATLIDHASGASAANIDLLLFSAPLTTAPVDNAASTPGIVAADLENLIDVISFPDSIAIAAGPARIYSVSPNKIIATAGSSKDLYAVPIVRNAYTPTSGGKFTFILGLLPRDLGLF